MHAPQNATSRVVIAAADPPGLEKKKLAPEHFKDEAQRLNEDGSAYFRKAERLMIDNEGDSR